MTAYELGVELALEKVAASPWLRTAVKNFEKGPALRRHMLERFKKHYGPRMLAGAGIGGTLGALTDETSILGGAALGAAGMGSYDLLRAYLKGPGIKPYERALVRT